jgi:pimeloyl-ACP methyl ester carboxylesterase
MLILPDASSGRTARRLLWATEPARSVVDAGTLVAGLPLLMLAPRGDGHPVLVLPGLLADDGSTLTLRRFATWLGYPAVGWSLGRNHGPTRRVVDGLPRLVDRLADRAGQPVTIVGWSLGGIFARRLALRMPDHVRQVITLGSPFGGSEERWGRTPGERAYRQLSSLHVADRIYPHDPADGLAVPSTAVFSRWDGIVDWRKCRQAPGPRSESVGVRASHLGLGHHPAVLWVVADRLAQPAGAWRPFRPPLRLGGVVPGLFFTDVDTPRDDWSRPDQEGTTWTA